MAVCSWCSSEDADCFESPRDRTVHICRGCHYIANIHIGVVPQGCIMCMKCKHTDGFSVQCGGATAHYKYAGEDTEGLPLYVVTKTFGNWNRLMRPSQVTCEACKSSIPIKAVYQSRWTNPQA